MTKSLTTGSSGYEGKRWDYRYIPDIFEGRDFFSGIRMKRVIAYFIDALIIGLLYLAVWVTGIIVIIMSLGLLAAPIVFIISLLPLIYHTLFVASSMQATPGMRLMGIRVYSFDGGAPSFLQALLLTVTFYGSLLLTSFLIMAVSLLNERGRCLHDYLCGVFVVNDLEVLDAE